MRNLIPHFIAARFDRRVDGGTFKACTMFVDISGFTQLTDALMAHEKDGAEVLTEVLNHIFEPLVSEVYASGGFISTFAGDGFTALFPVDTVPDAPLQVVRVAFFIQDFFARHPSMETPYGDFEMGVKVGLSLDAVQWGIQGGEGRYAYFFRGPAIDACAGAEHCAESGAVIAGPRLAARLRDAVALQPLDGHFVLAALAADAPPAPRHPAPPALERAALAPFVQDAVLAIAESDVLAEFRQVAPVFIGFEEPEDTGAFNTFVATVLNLTEDYGGYFNKLDFGDKGALILVLFGAPLAHENDALRAVDFLLALRAADTGVRWRAGFTYGVAYAGIMGGAARCEYTAIGDVVNFAVRLMTRAAWGEILVLDNVAQHRAFLAQHRELRVEQVGRFHYKGVAKPLSTYRLLGRRADADVFFDHALVGRQAELARLRSVARPAFEGGPANGGGFAGIVYIYGEAGIGKSHLAYELCRDLARRGDVAWLVAQTDQVLRQTFNPFGYVLRRYFDQALGASVEQNRARFQQRLDRLVANLDAVRESAAVHGRDVAGLREELLRARSILGALVGLHWPNSLYASLDGNLRYQNTLFAIKTLLLAESCLHPVILQVEDLHWLDEASRDALVTLCRNVEAYPLLIVITSRFADDGARPALPLAEEAPVTAVTLDALSGGDLRHLAESILGGAVDEALYDLLLERTQANPFFAQQFLYYFRENGLLRLAEDAQAANPVWTVKADIPSDVPTTINAILIARIDRLAQEVKDVVKAAAVLGREFDDRVLAHMLRSDVSAEVRAAEEEQIWSRVA